MLGALRRRFNKTATNSKSHRQSIEFHQNIDDDDASVSLAPPRFIEVEKGKISLVSTPTIPSKEFIDASEKNKEVLEARIAALESELMRMKRFHQVQNESPNLDADLKKQLQSLNRAMKTKDRRTMEVCREHKTLQSRFENQEACLQHLTNENKHLHQRIVQYEHCLDDVMRKVVDAIVAEDNLREEVSMLKARVRDLEQQNAELVANNGSCSPSSSAEGVNSNLTVVTKSKVRGDEGYCTMSSGSGAVEPQANHLSLGDNQLENLVEEDIELQHQEQPLEPYLVDENLVDESTSANMEDWSLSQEELGAAMYDENGIEHSWIWNSDNYLNSTVDSQSESISRLLQETISYSEDEEVTCKSFTKDFYKLVDINSESIRNLKSPLLLNDCKRTLHDTDTDDEDEDDDNESMRLQCGSSPTPSEAGRALLISCSSSSSNASEIQMDGGQILSPIRNISLGSALPRNQTHKLGRTYPSSSCFVSSTGWKKVSCQTPASGTSISLIPKRKETKIPTAIHTRRAHSNLS